MKSPLIRYRSAMKYRGVSIAQSGIKHFIVPLRSLIQNIPAQSTIFDLGCGEGILTNLLATYLPECKIFGFDLDEEKIEIANRNSPGNAEFKKADFFNLPTDIIPDVVIFNDVVHHLIYEKHLELLDLFVRKLSDGGMIILKEVDQFDKIDKTMTTFFDSKLYPEDQLSYRTVEEWRSLLSRIGIEEVKVERVKRFWPAARTLIYGKISDKRKIGYHDNSDEIGERNKKVNKDTTAVFITGGTGFIGNYLIRYLLHEGLEGKPVRVIMLVRNINRVASDIRDDKNVELLQGDLQDLPRLKNALAGVDYVFHLAAEVKFFNGADLWRNNSAGTDSLLKALEGVDLKRFIFASTIGAVDRSPSDPCLEPVDENTEPNPLSEYGESKLKAEIAVRESGFNHTIVRIPWAYGEGMTPDTHLRSLMQSVNDGKLFSYFNFPGKVSIITATDLARVFSFLAVNKKAENEVYFVTDGEPVSLGNLFKLMGNILGKKTAYIRIPKIITKIAQKIRSKLPLVLQNLNSDVLTASNSKSASLGFKPSLSKEEGMRILAESMNLIKKPIGENVKFVSLVTGAASGIGREISKELRELGHELLLVDRNEKDLKIISEELGADFIALDLTDRDKLRYIDEYLTAKNYELNWVINNAGIGLKGDFESTEFRDQESMIDLNCVAATFIAHLAIKRFKKIGKGTLVNIASSSAFQPLPSMAVYAATKSYMKNFSLALSGEMLSEKDIHVLTVHPSGTDTGFQDGAGVKKNEGESLLTPNYVAKTVIKAVESGKSEIIIGFSGKMMSLLSRLLPNGLQVKLWRYAMIKRR